MLLKNTKYIYIYTKSWSSTAWMMWGVPPFEEPPTQYDKREIADSWSCGSPSRIHQIC